LWTVVGVIAWSGLSTLSLLIEDVTALITTGMLVEIQKLCLDIIVGG